MSGKKQKVVLPVVIVEEHNDALHHIYRAIGSKRIPFNNGVMVHFDSHPDLVIPKDVNPERIYEKEHVLNSLSIENWIIPAVYAGHFSTVGWIKPVWASQLDNGVHNFKIGIEKTSRQIKVSCTQSYFVSELSWCPENQLENARQIMLEVSTLGEPVDSEDPLSEKKPPMMKPCSLSPELKQALDRGPYVLDIDLDFYSTRNPFLSMFNEEQFAMLRELYHYEHPKELKNEALQKVTENRRKQLFELESIFKNAKDLSNFDSTPRLESARRLLATFPTGAPPDPGVLNDAGCTCDDCDLPHHVSTPDEVRHLVEATREFLLSLPEPALVTVARSSRDDYCPPEDVDFIQELVLGMLKDVYGDIKVTIDYEDDTEGKGDEGTSTST